MDKELLKKFTKGNRKAFDELYNLYKKAVKGYIVTHTFGHLKKRADDIDQETWIIAWEKRGQFDTERSFYSYVRYWADIMIKRQLSGKPESVSLEDQEIEVPEPVSLPGGMEEKIELFFKLTFAHGGPPHQLISFGFNKLLSNWKIKAIIKDLSDFSLDRLFGILVGDYKVLSGLPEGVVDSLFAPLGEMMDRIVDEVLEDKVSKRTYERLLNKRVGDTLLIEYFGGNPEHNISDWTYKVRSRVLKVVAETIPGS